MFFWGCLARPSLWWEHTHTPGIRAGPSGITRALMEAPSIPCFLQMLAENVDFFPEERWDKKLCKVLGIKTSKIIIMWQQLEEVNKDWTRCQGQSSQLDGHQETDVSSSSCSASNRLDDLSQASHRLSPGLSFPLFKMRPLGPTSDGLWFYGLTSAIFLPTIHVTNNWKLFLLTAHYSPCPRNLKGHSAPKGSL